MGIYETGYLKNQLITMAAPQKSRMSLYANLLDTNPDSSGSISRAPVLFKQEDADKDASAKRQIDPGTHPVLQDLLPPCRSSR